MQIMPSDNITASNLSLTDITDVCLGAVVGFPALEVTRVVPAPLSSSCFMCDQAHPVNKRDVMMSRMYIFMMFDYDVRFAEPISFCDLRVNHRPGVLFASPVELNVPEAPKASRPTPS